MTRRDGVSRTTIPLEAYLCRVSGPRGSVRGHSGSTAGARDVVYLGALGALLRSRGHRGRTTTCTTSVTFGSRQCVADTNGSRPGSVGETVADDVWSLGVEVVRVDGLRTGSWRGTGS